MWYRVVAFVGILFLLGTLAGCGSSDQDRGGDVAGGSAPSESSPSKPLPPPPPPAAAAGTQQYSTSTTPPLPSDPAPQIPSPESPQPPYGLDAIPNPSLIVISSDLLRLLVGWLPLSSSPPASVWDLTTGKVIIAFPSPQTLIFDLSPDGRFAVAEEDKACVLVDLDTGRRKEITRGRFRVATVAYGAKHLLLCPDQKHELSVVDLTTDERKETGLKLDEPCDVDYIWRISCSPTAPLVVLLKKRRVARLLDMQYTATVYDFETLELVKELDLGITLHNRDPMRRMFFSRDGPGRPVFSFDGSIIGIVASPTRVLLCNTETWQVRTVLYDKVKEGSTGRSQCGNLSISPDRQMIALTVVRTEEQAFPGPVVEVRDLQSGECRDIVSDATCLGFLPNGLLAVSAEVDSTKRRICFFDPRSGEEQRMPLKAAD